MTILQRKKIRLENYVTTRNNHDSSLGILVTGDELSQYILVDENRR